MKFPLQYIVPLFVLCFALCGCVSTSYLASEYKKTYVLTEAVEIRACETFTGQASVLLGPKKVECIGAGSGELTANFPKGSLVKVEKLFKIGAIDAFYNECRVRISDTEGNNKVVYSDWPDLSKILVIAK